MDLPRLLRPSRPAPSARRAALRGAPVALPPRLDAAAERWWRLPPRVRGGILVTLVVLALAVVGRGATASPWGPPRPVLVAASDLPGGHALVLGDARGAEWPADLVPADALTAEDLRGAPTGPDAPRLAGPVRAGAPLARGDLVTGVSGLVGDGEAAVAVPVDGLPTVTAGDRVDVVATRTDGTGQRVASAARVLAVDGAFLWLGVPTDRVDAVAAGGAAGRLTLAVRPARPPP